LQKDNKFFSLVNYVSTLVNN